MADGKEPQRTVMAGHVHVVAKDGFQQGSFYDQNRPAYTDELVSRVVDNLYKGPNQGIKYHVLELGAGTGKFTKMILERLDKGCQYLASEPLGSFLSVLHQNVPDVETLVCTAQDIPLPDSSVQNIICAHSFHWFATDESLKEMTRVLVPEGRIFLVWNNRDLDVSWVQEAEDVITEYYDDETPRPLTKQWKRTIEKFSPLNIVEHVNLPGIDTMRGDKEFVLSHYLSISVTARLDAEEKEKARQKFITVIKKHFKPGQQIHIPFTSEYFCAQKVS